MNTKKWRPTRDPSIVEEAMAVEPTDANESAAAPQGAGSEVLLEDTDLETPSKKRKVCCKVICTLMCMFSIVPNMYRVSHSACVSERVFPTYYKTGDSPFRKKMESLPVAPVTPKSHPRHSRGPPEQLPSSCRARCRSPRAGTLFRTSFENHQNPGSNP